MRNFIQAGETLTLPAPYNLKGGEGALIGAIFGVAASDAPIGNNADLVTEGVFTLPKVSAQAHALGVKLYWDDSAKLVTSVSSANVLIGVAVEVAANPSGFATVRLNASF